jgi:carboxylesterase type B
VYRDGCQWSPVVDGVELTSHPYELALKGEVAPGVPLIIGSTADEGTSFIGYNRTGDDPDAPEYDMSAAQFKAWAGRIFGKNVTARIEELYPVAAGNTTGHSYKDHFIAAENLVSDYMMWCPVRRIARAHVESKVGGEANSTFVYIFSEVPGLNDASKDHEGVFHGADVRFSFFDEDQLVGWDEKSLSMAMVRYWTNFAEDGNPNTRAESTYPRKPISTGGVWWPAFDPKRVQHEAVLDFQLPIERVVYDRHGPQCDFWDAQPY